MSNYNSYHSSVKTSYALGIESQVLPTNFKYAIPRSTSQGWKTINPNYFVGSEFANQINVDLEQVKLLLDKRLRKIRMAFHFFCRLYITLLDFVSKNNFQKIILQNKESVIDLVDNLPVEFNRSLVCKFLQISEHQFKIWKSNRRFKCAFSLIGYCTKRFPSQISQKEINVLKSLKLAISKKRKEEKQKRKRGSVKASCPNEIWHIDVTEFITIDYVGSFTLLSSCCIHFKSACKSIISNIILYKDTLMFFIYFF